MGFGRRARIEPEAMIGLSGISLGGYLTSLVASLDDLACAILGVPAVDLVDLVDRHAGSHPHDPVRQTIRLAKPIGRMMSPFALTPRVPMQGRFIDAGVADRLVHPREQVTRLWEHWGKPEIHWYQGDPTVAARWYSLASRQKFKASRGSAPRCGISGACCRGSARSHTGFFRSRPVQVAVGSPGMLNLHASDLNLDPGANIYGMRAQRHHRDGHRSDPRPGSYERRLRCHSLIRRSGPQ